MAEVLAVRIDWNRTALDQRIASRFHTLHVDPEVDYPFGRKGLSLARAWRHLAQDDFSGMLILDGDVVIDPEDYAQMLTAIHYDPFAVVVAPVRIWPVSTKRKDWVWGHWTNEPGQEVIEDTAWWFTFCFTFLPRKLVEAAIRDGLSSWRYPICDRRVCETAQKIGMRIRIAPNCFPKHLNY